MDSKSKLQKKLAKLESENDQLVSELTYIDELMHLVGFSSGIIGLKQTAHEFCQQSDENNQEEAI